MSTCLIIQFKKTDLYIRGHVLIAASKRPMHENIQNKCKKQILYRKVMHPAKFEGTTPEHLHERVPQINEFF